jgi:hypothetical protein
MSQHPKKRPYLLKQRVCHNKYFNCRKHTNDSIHYTVLLISAIQFLGCGCEDTALFTLC